MKVATSLIAVAGLVCCLSLKPNYPYASSRLPRVQVNNQSEIQDNAPEAIDQDDAIPSANRFVSPQEIKQYVENHSGNELISLEQFWRRLGIPTEEWKQYGTCNAALFDLDLDSDPDTEVVLRLYDGSGWSMGGTRYLVFKAPQFGLCDHWRLLGFTDLEDQRYATPVHRVVTSGPHHWLVLTALTGRGSGYSLYHDLWYELSPRGLDEVVHYPSAKFLAYWEPDVVLKASSNIIGSLTTEGVTNIQIELSVSYALFQRGPTPEVLWEKNQLVTFSRNPESGKFEFNELQSKVTAKEFDSVYDGEGPTFNQILRYNYSELLEIAKSQDDQKKEWLRAFLNKCKDTSAKNRLMGAISASNKRAHR